MDNREKWAFPDKLACGTCENCHQPLGGCDRKSDRKSCTFWNFWLVERNSSVSSLSRTFFKLHSTLGGKWQVFADKFVSCLKQPSNSESNHKELSILFATSFTQWQPATSSNYSPGNMHSSLVTDCTLYSGAPSIKVKAHTTNGRSFCILLTQFFLVFHLYHFGWNQLASGHSTQAHGGQQYGPALGESSANLNSHVREPHGLQMYMTQTENYREE